MGAYLLRRLLLIVPTLIGIMLVNFTLTQFVPGGPIAPGQKRLDAVDHRDQALARTGQRGGGGAVLGLDLAHRGSSQSCGARARWEGTIGATLGGAGGSPPAAASMAAQAAKCGARFTQPSSVLPHSGVQEIRISTSTVEGRPASAP